jgi:hypothetical protein
MFPKPLVFVPGLPGTAILDGASGTELFPNLLSLTSQTLRPELLVKLSGPDDPDADDGVVAGDPIRFLIKALRSSFLDFGGTLKQADTLYDILSGLGYSQFSRPFGDRFRPVGWDWRRPVDQGKVLADVERAIAELHQATGERVSVLCHSTGGLVVRSLLEGNPQLVDLVERVLAIGVCWAGTLQSLPLLAGQSGWGPLTAAEAQRALGRSWAAFDLLPPDPAHTDMADAEGDLDFFTDGGGQASPLVNTGWIPPGGPFDALRARAARSYARFGARGRSLQVAGKPLEVVNIAGWGASTLTGCKMDGQGRLVFASSEDGDGTQPRRSVTWLQGDGVKTFLVPVGHYEDSQIERVHITLWQNRPVRDLLSFWLAGSDWLPYTYAAVDSGDAIDDVPNVRVRLVALDAQGKPLAGAYAQALDLNPPSDTKYLVDAGDGRGMMVLQRENIGQSAGGGWWRFEVQFHWQEGGQDRTSPRQALLVQKPE